MDSVSALTCGNHSGLTYENGLIQGAEAIGKSSSQALAKIKTLFNASSFNKNGSAFTGLTALQLSARNASVLVFGLCVLIV